VAGDRLEDDQVAAFVGHHGRARGEAGQVHRDLGHLGKGPAHAVGVRDRQADPGGPGDREQAVRAADLGGHERRDPAPGELLQVLAQPAAFVPVLDLLHADRRRADRTARHDQGIIGQFVQVHQGDGAEVLGGLQDLQQPEIWIAATAGAEHGAAARQGTQRVGVEQALHVRAVV
jgi:hypothetical protein